MEKSGGYVLTNIAIDVHARFEGNPSTQKGPKGSLLMWRQDAQLLKKRTKLMHSQMHYFMRSYLNRCAASDAKMDSESEREKLMTW